MKSTKTLFIPAFKQRLSHFNWEEEVIRKKANAGPWWLTPVILATQEAEIWRIASLGKNIHNTLS
jgi:hypothetical protein